MKVFITWSGDLSHAVAEALRDWLPGVIQALDPFLSSEDVRHGQRWPQVVGEHLQSTSFGLVCLTKENAKCHPWIHFEAGAIAKSVTEGHLAVLLIDMAPAELEWPLQQFQATVATDKAQMEKLVKSLNQAAGSTVDATRLRTQFDKYWADFDQPMKEALRKYSGKPTVPTASRSPIELALEQILQLQKEQHRLLQQVAKTRPTHVAELLRKRGVVRFDLDHPNEVSRHVRFSVGTEAQAAAFAMRVPQLIEYVNARSAAVHIRSGEVPGDQFVSWEDGPDLMEVVRKAKELGLDPLDAREKKE
jgi:hypothetical protein